MLRLQQQQQHQHQQTTGRPGAPSPSQLDPVHEKQRHKSADQQQQHQHQKKKHQQQQRHLRSGSLANHKLAGQLAEPLISRRQPLDSQDERENCRQPPAPDKLDTLDGKARPSVEPGRHLASGSGELGRHSEAGPDEFSSTPVGQQQHHHEEPGSGQLGGGNAGRRPRRKGHDQEEEDDDDDANRRRQVEEEAAAPDQRPSSFKAELVWRNIILFVILHSMIPVGLYQIVTQWPLRTCLWMVSLGYLSGLGVTGGTHRLWSHRSYKASLPVELLLMALQTMAGQNSIYIWSRDHRVHHKFSETDADPHNIKRGFFFAHMGWLCCRKHPDVKTKGALIDMSDLEANPVVMFQLRHFWWLSIIFNLLIPVLVPVWLWQERLATSFVLSFGIRYLLSLHGTWLVNSAAHYYGHRPYDSRIEARESPAVILMGFGEGFHNYHHTFPYDYSTSEYGRYFNLTTAFIDLCAALGLASDRRKVEPSMVLRRQLRTGDGTGLDKLAAPAGAAKRPAALAAHQATAGAGSGQLDMIHELPYISGLTSMKYTM